MLKIQTFALGPLATNAYLISKPGENRAFVIDPGMNPEQLLEALENLELEAIVLTHAHFDHIGGVDIIRKRKGCPVYIHPLEQDWLTDPHLNGSDMWPDITPPISTAPAEFLLEDGQELTLLGETFKIFHTPGHSPGSISLLWEDHLFCGDVLFYQSVGRTDLRGGDFQTLYRSIHDKLFVLSDRTTVHPGHGPQTSIGFEKENNPFV